MGLQLSKPQQHGKPNQISSSSYYGCALTHNSQTNTTYQQFVIEEKDFQKFIELIKTRQELEHNNFITVKNYWKKVASKDNFSCTGDKRIEVVVEYQSPSENLSKKLDKLSEISKGIPENQLKNICLSMVKCLMYLKFHGTCHGDIKPQSVYFDNLGQVKLLDSFFMNGGRTSYEIVMENPSSMSLLSPQQLSRLRDKQFDDISLVHKNQSFSLGLTLYECMTFQPAMECYDLEKLRIKKNFFKGKHQLMYNKGYSKKFIDIVMSLILKPAEDRLQFDSLFNIMRQFSF